jgi:two-component system response regulator FixJ
MADNRSGPVAVVDDDPAVLDSLKFLLEVAGYKVTVYPSAAAFLGNGATRPACLILDHHMPQMTGLELVSRLRSQNARTPVLLITSLLSSAIADRAAQLGIEMVLEKPLKEDDLLSFVDAHR